MVNPLSLSGTRKIEIPIALLDLGTANIWGKLVFPDRLFIRAFARSQQRESRCVPDPKSGSCLWRYAYTNPIWAYRRTHQGVCPKDRPVQSIAMATASPTDAIRARTATMPGVAPLHDGNTDGSANTEVLSRKGCRFRSR